MPLFNFYSMLELYHYATIMPLRWVLVMLWRFVVCLQRGCVAALNAFLTNIMGLVSLFVCTCTNHCVCDLLDIWLKLIPFFYARRRLACSSSFECIQRLFDWHGMTRNVLHLELACSEKPVIVLMFCDFVKLSMPLAEPWADNIVTGFMILMVLRPVRAIAQTRLPIYIQHLVSFCMFEQARQKHAKTCTVYLPLHVS